MGSIYKNRDVWYITVCHQNKRISKSLKTKDHKVAKQLKPLVESQIIMRLTGLIKEHKDIPFKELVRRYLSNNKHLSKSTLSLYRHVLESHLNNKPLPTNVTSRAIFTRVINTCWNWGLKNKLIQKAYKLSGDTKGESRDRVFNKVELELMFCKVKDDSFNNFVRFAYYTGARSGEIRSISRENLLSDSLVVTGKTGRRIVKLNTQARNIISAQECLWNYKKDYVSHKFKKEVRKLGIRNARFHDLRRTFGLNLIKQGMSIYKVSKLLGHKSVRTTEQHYAPLMTVEIEDFEL